MERCTFQATLHNENARTVGVYPKIWGMILQQGFGNPEVIPIDEWIQAFYTIPLRIGSKEEFLNSSQELENSSECSGLPVKSQDKHVHDFNWIWCLKYGTGKTTVEVTEGDQQRLRGANPLSCLNCPLKDTCLAYAGISSSDVYVMQIKDEVPKENELNPGESVVCRCHAKQSAKVRLQTLWS